MLPRQNALISLLDAAEFERVVVNWILVLIPAISVRIRVGFTHYIRKKFCPIFKGKAVIKIWLDVKSKGQVSGEIC